MADEVTQRAVGPTPAPTPGGRDTVAALASGRGRAGVAVIRISGPQARAVLEALGAGRAVERPRRAVLAALRAPLDQELLDQALVLWFPAPRSYTGEDVAELQVHGGPAVIEAVLEAVTQIAGVRLAEPGEFTRRAFENGRLDLTEAEGILDLVAAETQAQRRQALAQSSGALAGAAGRWQDAILEAAARLEALLDFADEEIGDEDAIAADVAAALGGLGQRMDEALAAAARGRRIRAGLKVVILGPPNAGKSTLLNALAEEDVAIVSPEPGTTRDALTVRLELAGVPVTLVDTAGLRSNPGAIEAEGIRRARRHAEEAELALWLTPVGAAEETPPEELAGRTCWRVTTKIDLQGAAPAGRIGENRFAVSALTGAGLGALVEALAAWAQSLTAGPPAIVTRRRQEEAVRAAAAGVKEARALLAEGDCVLAAEALRRAEGALARLTGRGGVEEMLDRLFAEFCIGK